MKIFKLSKTHSIVARHENTRSGFRHLATLMSNGREICDAKATYLNRTWEVYEFQSVLYEVIEKCNSLTDAEKKRFTAQIKSDKFLHN